MKVSGGGVALSFTKEFDYSMSIGRVVIPYLNITGCLLFGGLISFALPVLIITYNITEQSILSPVSHAGHAGHLRYLAGLEIRNFR